MREDSIVVNGPDSEGCEATLSALASPPPPAVVLLHDMRGGDRVLYGPHRTLNTPMVDGRFGVRARVTVRVRGTVPSGIGPIGLEKRRSCSVQIRMRSTTHAALSRITVTIHAELVDVYWV